LPVDQDQHILKNKLIRLSGKKAIEVGIDQVTPVRVNVYDSDKDVQLELITH